MLSVAIALVLLVGPLLLAARGFATSRPAPSARPGWRLTIVSTLFCALAFNLIFFIQELALVVPKALTPGLHPVLFHNNHDWTGANPRAELLQGTGALAILLAGLGFAALLARGAGRSMAARLFVQWMAFHGIFMALPQVVMGAIIPMNDVGRAMAALGFSEGAKTAAALAALLLIPFASLWFARSALALTGPIEAPAGRTGFVLRAATLPAIMALPLIIPFRVPGPVIEVALVPVIVMIAGIGWMQAGAWRAHRADVPAPRSRAKSPLRPLLALAALLLFFQIILRPGIAF